MTGNGLNDPFLYTDTIDEHEIKKKEMLEIFTSVSYDIFYMKERRL